MDAQGRNRMHPARLQAVKLGLTCSSAIAAEAVTYPIDMLKTRLQLQVRGGTPDSTPSPSPKQERNAPCAADPCCTAPACVLRA